VVFYSDHERNEDFAVVVSGAKVESPCLDLEPPSSRSCRTEDTYGKWLPLGNKAAVDRLDATIIHESGSNLVAEEVSKEEANIEVSGNLVGRVEGSELRPPD
jgi:hypothetical protein